jgi:hypothetical protein
VYPAKLYFIIEGEIKTKPKGIYDHEISNAEDT